MLSWTQDGSSDLGQQAPVSPPSQVRVSDEGQRKVSRMFATLYFWRGFQVYFLMHSKI